MAYFYRVLSLIFNLFCAAGMMSAVWAQDYEREARWRSEIEPTILVGDAVDLMLKERKVFAIFTPAAGTNVRADVAAVLVHGVGVHPDFGLIGKLRGELAERGIATLSVQMPVLAKEVTDANAYQTTFPEASARIAAAGQWLQSKGYRKLFLVSHSMGAWMSNVYLDTATASMPYIGWVAIGITGRMQSTAQYSGAILDLYGQNDFKSVLDAAWLRSIKMWFHPNSERVIVPEATHYFENHEKNAADAIEKIYQSHCRITRSGKIVELISVKFNMPAPHHVLTAPSPWVMRFAPLLIAPGSAVIDIASGSGRNARAVAHTCGAKVLAVDRDESALAMLSGVAGVSTQCLDLETPHWPLAGQQFDAVIVVNYLWRAHFEHLLALIKPDGALIYETFAAGNEAYGKPSRPDFLLQPDELLQRLHGRMQIVAFEQGKVGEPTRAVVQRVAAVGLQRSVSDISIMTL